MGSPVSERIILTQVELDAIVRHTQALIDSQENLIQGLLSIPKDRRGEAAASQIAYWTNVVSGLKWSLGIAKQRKLRDNRNGPNKSIHGGPVSS